MHIIFAIFIQPTPLSNMSQVCIYRTSIFSTQQQKVKRIFAEYRKCVEHMPGFSVIQGVAGESSILTAVILLY